MVFEIANEEDFEAIERWGNHAGHNAMRFEDIPKIEALDPCPMEYLVEPLIVGRSITTLTGEAGCGKSTLALFLAALAAEKGRVLYLDRENPLHVVQERFKRLAVHEGNNLRYMGGWSEVPLPSSEFVKGVVFDSKPSPLMYWFSVKTRCKFHGKGEITALRAGIFKAWGSINPMLGWAARTSCRPVIVSMSPSRYPSAELRPRRARFRFP